MIKAVIAAGCFILMGAAAAFGQNASERMSFTGSGPKPEMIPIIGSAWTIYAAGKIDPDAGKRLKLYLEKNQVPPESIVYLDSPGGSVVSGMELGRLFRQHRVRTYVGRRGPANDTKPASCFSACALAFLGGEFRYLTQGSRYGVHRFYFQQEAAVNADVAQLLSAAIGEYLRMMDIDPSLLSISAATDSTDMFEPTASQLMSLRVVNNGVSSVKWSIESIPAGIYLKGERNTTFGINKFIITCVDRRPSLYVVIDPQGRGEMIKNFRADTLYVDGNRLPLESLIQKKQLVNGWVNAFYDLPDRYLGYIKGAKKTVGVIMQGGYDAPVFFGFDGMPFEDGSKRLPGFLKACGRI